MTGIRRKHEFDNRIALECGKSQKLVRNITSAFLCKIMEALADFEEVHLDGFGVFRLVVEKSQEKPTIMRAPKGGRQTVYIKRKMRVHFSKSVLFKRLLQNKWGPGATKEKEHEHG